MVTAIKCDVDMMILNDGKEVKLLAGQYLIQNDLGNLMVMTESEFEDKFDVVSIT